MGNAHPCILEVVIDCHIYLVVYQKEFSELVASLTIFLVNNNRSLLIVHYPRKSLLNLNLQTMVNIELVGLLYLIDTDDIQIYLISLNHQLRIYQRSGSSGEIVIPNRKYTITMYNFS